MRQSHAQPATPRVDTRPTHALPTGRTVVASPAAASSLIVAPHGIGASPAVVPSGMTSLSITGKCAPFHLAHSSLHAYQVGCFPLQFVRSVTDTGLHVCHNSDRLYLEGVFHNFSRCGNLANLMCDDVSMLERKAIALSREAFFYFVL